ncbi:hypothetical protein JXA84_01725 [candidate division WOR-3 bacterium]|nr:hypothetical protein [candidate division WOR-3 bacterium]
MKSKKSLKAVKKNIKKPAKKTVGTAAGKTKNNKKAPVLNDKKIPPKKERSSSLYKDCILYASGDLNLSSIKNNEFFLAARANVKVTGKKVSVEIKGVVKITLAKGDQIAENLFFDWLDEEASRDHIFEDREKKWLGKWIKTIESFNNLDDKNIKKIPIDWDYIAKREGPFTEIFKAVHSSGWAKSYENPVGVNTVKKGKKKFKPSVIRSAIQKNPLPVLIPFYRFLDSEGKRIYENENIKDIIVIEN